MTSTLTVLVSNDQLLRARIVRTDAVVAEAIIRHLPSPLAAHALARALTATALFPWEWKAGEADREERVAIQWSGRGKLGTLVTELRAPARLRAMVTHADAPGLPMLDDTGRPRNTGLADGYVSVLTQNASGRVTQGVVDLVDGTIDRDLELYFTQSQQIATRLRVCVATEGRPMGLGVLVQALPDSPPDALDNFHRLDGLTASSTMEEAIAAAFGDVGGKILSETVPEYACPCSRERIYRSLRLLDQEALEDMRETDHGAEVICEFCRDLYTFDEDDLLAVLQDKRSTGAAGPQ